MLDLEIKKTIANEYIDQQDFLKSAKEIDGSVAILMWEVEEGWATKKTKEALEDFLVSENIFEGISDNIFKQNFSAITFLSEQTKQEINKAKEIINDRAIDNEDAVRIKLWLKTKNQNPTTTPDVSTQNTENIPVIENLKVEEDFIYDSAIKYWVTDTKQLSYILATVKGECWFKNIKEVGWENQTYWKVDIETWQRYYGRGFVQLTHKENYRKFNEIIKNSWEKFKDNNWDYLLNIDILKHPDQILKSNELAAFILIYGMKNGTFTWKKLDDYINSNKNDFVWARAIVNGDDKAAVFAQNAQYYINNTKNNQQAA